MTVTFLGAGGLQGQTTGAASWSVARPTVVAGDLMVCYLFGGSGVGSATCAGWTVYDTQGSSNRALRILYKIAGGSEPGSYTFAGGNADQVGFIVAYRGVNQASPFDGAAQSVNASSVNSLANSVSPATADAFLTTFHGTDASRTFTPPAGMTEWYDSGTGIHSIEFNYQQLSASGATGTRTATISSAAATQTYTLAIKANQPPSAPGAFTAPTGASNFDGVHTVTHGAATDAEGATLQYELQISTNGGGAWSAFATLSTSLSRSLDFSAIAATSTARLRVRAWDGLQYGAWTETPNFTVQHNQAPYAPTLVAPANGSVADLAAGFTADWTFSDPNAGDSQTAYYLRRKVAGAGSYEYWNAGTGAFQAGEVKNSAAATAVAFAAGLWSNGVTYNWSVATEDALGVKGPYATDATVTGNSAPVLTVDAPSGTVTDTSTPVVEWSESDVESDPQQTYEVRVFTAAQYGIGGFNPATSPATWDTDGEVASVVARDRQVGDGGDPDGATLVDGVSYRAYVRVKAGGIYSEWGYSAFTLDLTAPSAPTVSVVQGENPVSGSPRVEVTVTGTHDPLDFPDVTYLVETSDNAGGNWETLASGLVPDGGLEALTFDYEAPPGSLRLYRAYTVAEV